MLRKHTKKFDLAFLYHNDHDAKGIKKLCSCDNKRLMTWKFNSMCVLNYIVLEKSIMPSLQ
jgi:hypothetical protein